MAFIVDIKTKGKKAVFELRENGHSYLQETDYEHLIPSWDMNWSSIVRLASSIAEFQDNNLDLIVKNLDLKRLGVRLRLIPFSRREIDFDKHSAEDIEWMKKNGRFVLWAFGPPEMKKYLPHDFIVGSKNDPRNNVVRMLRWQDNYPFSDYRDITKKVSLEDLLKEKKVAYDIEVSGWKEGKDRIESCSFVTFDKFGNYIVVREKIGIAKIEVDTPFGNIETNIISGVGNKFGKVLSDLFHEFDPLFSFVHYGKYDNSQLVALEKDFLPGLDNSRPKIRAGGATYIKRWNLRRGFLIDTCSFSQNWLFLPNNKLFSVGNYLFDLKESKKYSYDELENLDPIEKIAYNINDGVICFKIGEWSLKNILLMSYMFRQNPESVVSTAKDELGVKIHEEQQFKQLHTHGKRTFESAKKLEEFDVGEEKKELLFPDSTSKRGLFDATLLYFTPFIEGLRQVIVADEYSLKTYKEYLKTNDPIQKVILAQGLEAYLRKALFDLKELSPTKFKGYIDYPRWVPQKSDWFFGRIFGIKNGPYDETRNVMTLNNEVVFRFLKIRDFLQDHSLVNFSNKFVLVGDDIDISKLSEFNLAIKLGYGKAISLETGRFTININNRLITQQQDITGKKGNRTLYEEELLQDIFRLVLIEENKDLLIERIEQAIEYLRNAEKENLLFLKEEVLRNFDDYSDRGQLQERVKAYIKYAIKKGEKFGYGYAKDYGIIKIPDFLNPKYKIDTERYREKFFGVSEKKSDLSSGTIGNILYSIFCFDNGVLINEKEVYLKNLLKDKQLMLI